MIFYHQYLTYIHYSLTIAYYDHFYKTRHLKWFCWYLRRLKPCICVSLGVIVVFHFFRSAIKTYVPLGNSFNSWAGPNIVIKRYGIPMFEIFIYSQILWEKVPLVLYIKFYVLFTLAVNKVHFLREYTARSFQDISLMKTYENRQWTNNGKIISYND